jgi:hypothetical protein|tara:strand:+ start:9618 stop:9821 length:204 start_codon:yes stop_codon:yes gene_type:complete
MAHEFVLLINGELKTFTKYEDIPEDFDNVIKFLPDVPHEEVDHDGPNIWNDRLQELMQKERDNASSM